MKSRRFHFVATLSCLAAVYGSILAYRLLHYQADVGSDILKMSILIFFGTALSSYFWWTLIVMKWPWGLRYKPWGGALTGFLSAVCIIPVPTFVGAFKGEFIAHHNLVTAIYSGLQYSISTFSLAEMISLPLSSLVGFLWVTIECA